MEDPWGALDVDDSDLPFLLRPCSNKRHHTKSNPSVPTKQSHLKNPSSQLSQSLSPQTLISSPSQQHLPPPTTSAPRRIPGPAGAVQAAMSRKRSHDFSEEEAAIPTQEYVRRAVENAEEFYEDDDDFRGEPWLRAIELLNAGQSGNVDFVLRSTPLSCVSKRLKNGKVDQVVAVIKSCRPNGLGDLMVTLKDPTGTIDGSIHRKVLSESEFAKDISVSSVVILEKVSMFAPSQTTLYLNITQSNVVKVFGKDIDHPLRQTRLAPKITYALPNDSSGKTRMLQKTFSLEQGRIEGMMNKATQVSDARGSGHINNQKEDENPPSGSDNCNNPSMTSQHIEEIFEEEVAMERNENLAALDRNVKSQTSDNLSNRSQCSSVAANSVEERRQPMISKATIPQWTDEQLNELFAGEFDDDGPLF